MRLSDDASGNALGDHPDMRRVPGIDFSSGSLGHGLSVATGMAVSARLRGYADTRVWVLLGDQELNEGQIWEAAQTANHYGLGNLYAIVDRNEMGLDGHTEEVLTVEPIGERFRAFGWEVREVNGHDPTALLSCLLNLPDPGSGRPHLVVAHTVKGKGVEYMEMSRVRSPSFRPRDGPSGDHGDASTVESAWFRLNGALPGALVALRNGS